MRTSPKIPDLFAGVDAPSLDIRTFHISQSDIEAICRFFSLGKLKSYKQEKGTAVSHSNFFVFAKTSHGEYALKFFPSDAARSISIEYAINRFLISRDFPTPEMHSGRDGKAYTICNGRLATCFTFINGTPAWQHVEKPGTVEQINSSILSLKKILADAPAKIPRIKQDSFAETAKGLAQASQKIAHYHQKEFIDQSLKQTCLIYQKHRRLFTREWLHNNTTLTNFLFYKRTVYTLDLSHIKEDYGLSDLASLVISCHFLGVSQLQIKAFIKNHSSLNDIGPELYPVLNTLLRIGLIKEYLKNVHREAALRPGQYPAPLAKTYLFYLQKRKKSIISLLKK